MQKKDTFKLILKTTIYDIPSKFQFLDDIDPNIFSLLTSQGYYKVKSNVSKKIFNSFINNWISGEVPMINDDNISEYDLLSQEFDRMQNIIQLYKNIHKDKQKLSLLNQQINFSQTIKILKSNKSKKLDKYQQSIQLLKSIKWINTFSNFLEIKNKLETACKSGDISKLTKIIQKTVILNGLTYILNDEDNTAKLIDGIDRECSVNIPKSIRKSDKDYLITEIHGKFNIMTSLQSITFAANSCIRVFGESVFSGSKIQRLCIPASVENLQEGWYFGLDNVTELTIQPGNKHYKMYDNKLLLSKSDPKSKDFDTLIFAKRNIQNVTIPSFVKIIGEHSFDKTTELKKVVFEKNSKLQIIKDYSFLMSSIESISLPSSVLILKPNWCARVKKLTDISIFNNNQVNITYYDNKFILGKSDLCNDVFDILLFARRDIEIATIPSFIKRIGSSAFFSCTKLKQVYFPSDSKIELIENGAFCDSSIESILIPSTVTKIEKYAFSECDQLKEIKFEDNSKLKKIGSNAFSLDNFDNIMIPSQVTEIKRDTFLGSTIQHIGFQIKSKIKTICCDSFNMSSIETISLPSNVHLQNNCFGNLEDINSIEIYDIDDKIITNYDNKFILGKSNPKSDVFDVLLFARRDIETVIIPSYIKRIGPSSFYKCYKLTHVYFEPQSQLEIIFNEAFAFSSIKSISLPPSVKLIYFDAFNHCKNLKYFKFPDNPNFTTIPLRIFLNAGIENVTIPSSVTNIEDSAFYLCKIRNVTFTKDSKINQIEDSAFSCCKFLKEINIPPLVTDIKSNAFYNCKKLEKVRFTDNSKLKIIDKNAFNASSLICISIPANVRYIGKYAFLNCKKMQLMELNENIESISIHETFLTHSFSFHNEFIMMVSKNTKIEIYTDHNN